MIASLGPDILRTLKTENRDYRDAKLTGFILRCRASGKHSYIVTLGRGRSKTIGRVGEMSPEAARLTAQSMLAAVSKNTLANMADDPTLTLREARTKARGTVRRTKAARQTWRQFLAEHYGPWAVANRKTGDETLARLQSLFAEFNDVRLAEMSSFAIERWRVARLKAGAQPATVNRDFASLRGALSWAVATGILKPHQHPMSGVKSAKIDTTERTRFLSADEERTLRDALTARDDRRREERERANVWRRERGYEEWPTFGTYTDHLHPITLIALNTGCRRGELLDLTWQDVDLGAGRLTVRAASAKSGKSRVVPLNSEALSVLKTWRPATFEPGAYVFPAADGSRLQDLKTAFLALVRGAGIKGFRFHDLRHTFASKLVQAGVDLNRLRALLGHGDVKMVLRYAHLRDEDLAAAVAKLVSA